MLTSTSLFSTAINLAWTQGLGVIKSAQKTGGLADQLPKLLMPAISSIFSFEVAHRLYPVIAGRVHILPTNSPAAILTTFLFGAFLASLAQKFVDEQWNTAHQWRQG